MKSFLFFLAFSLSLWIPFECGETKQVFKAKSTNWSRKGYSSGYRGRAFRMSPKGDGWKRWGWGWINILNKCVSRRAHCAVVATNISFCWWPFFQVWLRQSSILKYLSFKMKEHQCGCAAKLAVVPMDGWMNGWMDECPKTKKKEEIWIRIPLMCRKAGHGPDGWMVGPEVDHTSFMVTTRNQVGGQHFRNLVCIYCIHPTLTRISWIQLNIFETHRPTAKLPKQLKVEPVSNSF